MIGSIFLIERHKRRLHLHAEEGICVDFHNGLLLQGDMDNDFGSDGGGLTSLVFVLHWVV